MVGALIREADRCLVAQRGPGMRLPGKWELPGGKVEPGESAQAALAREIEEELGLEVAVGDWIGRGQAIQAGNAVTLDVYAASIRRGVPEPREHAETRWVGATELRALDWAAADVPVLPAVECFLRPLVDDHRAWPRCVISADWSVHPGKRAVWVARETSGSWTLARQAPPPDGWNLHALLDLARRSLRDGPVLVGIDAVLGLPLAFTRAAGQERFLDLIGSLALAATGTPAAPHEWAYGHPFFRVAAGVGGLLGFIQAAGGRGVLLRQIELHTGAKPVFVLSGIPGTVGSGSVSLWTELAPTLAEPARDFGIWPFEGSLRDLLVPGGITLAETYPRAAYAITLADRLPVTLRSLAKTRAEVRLAAVASLQRSRWSVEAELDLRDTDRAIDNEDDFDAMMTAAGIARLCLESAPLSCALVDPAAEGGILPTGGIALRRTPPGLR